MSTTVLSENIPGWDLRTDAVHEPLDPELLVRAYRFSERAHEGQTRSSGDPYVTHCVEVAKTLADLQLDTVTVAAGVLDDGVGGTLLSLGGVGRGVGPPDSAVVDGAAKKGPPP